MKREPKILAANPVRKKQRIWQQIKITAFAKKMGAKATLEAEKCCDEYHQDLRRDKTPYRKHPKRVLRIFIYYTLYILKISYDDEEGASILLHDVPEEINLSTLGNIKEKYGQLIPIYVKIFTKMEGDSRSIYFEKIAQTDFFILFKICDMIDGFLGMIDEYYAGLDSSSEKRIANYLKGKAFLFIEIIRNRDLSGLKYREPILEALDDFKLICQEAQDLLKANY